MFSRLHSLFLAGALLLAPVASKAVPIYDNLAQPAFGSDAVTATAWNANKFVTDGSPYYITSVVLQLSGTNTSSALEVLLYSDSSNAPGAQLASIGSTSSIPGSATNVTFTPGGTVNLAANTAYWIVARTSGSGNYPMYFPTTSVGNGVAYNSSYSRSSNGGSTWATQSGPPYYMQVNAEVPEPSTLLLSGFGLVFAGLIRRRSA